MRLVFKAKAYVRRMRNIKQANRDHGKPEAWVEVGPPSEMLTPSQKLQKAVAESEAKLCECDRPDELENPHRHDFDVACVYWQAGRPSYSARQEVLRKHYKGGW